MFLLCVFLVLHLIVLVMFSCLVRAAFDHFSAIQRAIV